jgi:hypothetical protein
MRGAGRLSSRVAVFLLMAVQVFQREVVVAVLSPVARDSM